MTPFPWGDVVIIAILVLLNGVFAMSELAIVSARDPRLQAAEKRGSRGARIARQLAADPGRFLSTVQVGITLIGVLTGAYSGASLGQPVAERLQPVFGFDDETALTVAFAVVIALTTYFSLIAGELVPKQFALRAPERIAIVMAVPMLWLSRVAAPLVWLLNNSSGLVFRLLGLSRESEDRVTAEELHLIVAEASKSGVIEESERAIISGVVRLADRPVREVMTPRIEVDWIDIASDADAVRAKLLESPHTRLPVARGSVDDIVGVVQARDIAGALFRGETLDLELLTRSAKVIHDQIDAMDALENLRAAEVPMLLVHDEYGHFEGLVTPADLLSAIMRRICLGPGHRQRTLRGRTRRRQPADRGFDARRPDGRTAGDRAGRGPRLCDRRRPRARDIEASAEGGRALHRPWLALRDRRHGRAQDRQIAGQRDRQAEGRRGRLTFSCLA